MIEAYFFDLDGTLADTEILWVEAMELLAREHGHTLSRTTSLDMVYGISWPEVYERFQERFPGVRWTLEEMAALLARHFMRLRDSRDVRIAGSIALLRRLAASHPVAVVSGSYRADVESALDLMEIRSLLRFHLGHEDYAPGKPDPACYSMAADKMGVDPGRCVVFEDSNAGICAAKAAGMYGVALARPGRPWQDYSLADLVLQDLEHFDSGMLPVPAA